MAGARYTEPMGGANSERWWVIYETHLESDAHIVAGRLRAEGIPTQILSYAGASAIGITVGVFGEIRLLVPAVAAARARALLEAPAELSADNDRIIFPPGEDVD